ncbi:MAG: alanine-tRNA synthetase second additional domain-containing protein [Treponema sp.]|nr:alanine-tRNA synthetase second additional domain-containing protein [Treponema sp.]
MRNIIHGAAFYSVYFAPRGRERLLFLGEEISQRHLTFDDRLIGIIGDAGSGKSSLIKGMFPGLELVNDDEGINPHKVMQMQVPEQMDSLAETTTYHLDMRFQTAFTQMHEIVSFVRQALEKGRRVIVEHFDILYPALKMHAEIMIGIGEEIIVTRPGVFGPIPKDIGHVVHTSLKFRKQVHTAEDICTMLLERDLQIKHTWRNSDVRRGFVLVFDQLPDIDLALLEKKILETIASNLDVAYYDEDHIQIGNFEPVRCNGPRIHVRNTSEIDGFKLLDSFTYDRMNDTYSLVGLIGSNHREIFNLNRPVIF